MFIRNFVDIDIQRLSGSLELQLTTNNLESDYQKKKKENLERGRESKIKLSTLLIDLFFASQIPSINKQRKKEN